MAKEDYIWVPVKSSVVQALCFERTEAILMQGRRKTRWAGTLYVAFHAGGIYQYDNVLETTYETIRDSRSAGATVNALLRQMAFTRLRENTAGRRPRA